MPRGSGVGICAQIAEETQKKKLILLLRRALVALLVQVEEGISIHSNREMTRENCSNLIGR